MTVELFDHEAAWQAPNYELAMVYNHAANQIVERALAALWNMDEIIGAVRSCDEPIHAQVPIDVMAASRDELDGAYGCVTLPDGVVLPCKAFITDYAKSEAGLPLFIRFVIPCGALDITYGGLWETMDSLELPHPWKRWAQPLNDWLAFVAERVFPLAPFDVAAIGLEVGGLEELEMAKGDEGLSLVRPSLNGTLEYRQAVWD
jgi:hypothetical protein